MRARSGSKTLKPIFKRKAKTMTQPRIYIADLAAYNTGILHGVWIDATDDLNDIQAQINTMLASSPVEDSEEYALHDYEGFDGIRFSEWESLQDLHDVACFIEEHGKLGAELFNHFNDLKETKRALEDHYHGEFTSLSDYAENFTSDTTDIPEHLKPYIDYEAMGKDWEMSGDIYTIETGFEEVHIFSNH